MKKISFGLYFYFLLLMSVIPVWSVMELDHFMNACLRTWSQGCFVFTIPALSFFFNTHLQCNNIIERHEISK